jgi:VanZ family protein
MLQFFEEHNRLSWAITFVGAGLIFYISSLSFEDSVAYTINFLSTAYHFSAFFCFSFFLFISMTRGRVLGINFFAGILISVAYAISDEIHQFFVPGRYCSLFDATIDSAGILFAFIAYFILILGRKN